MPGIVQKILLPQWGLPRCKDAEQLNPYLFKEPPSIRYFFFGCFSKSHFEIERVEGKQPFQIFKKQNFRCRESGQYSPQANYRILGWFDCERIKWHS